MKGNDLTLGDFVKNRTPLVVPAYQRAYSWDKKEVKDFISDLKSLFESRANGGSAHSVHFFGSIVLVQKVDPVYEVVDGQQRLTTLTLTLAQLVAAFKKVSELAAKSNDPNTQNEAANYAEQIFEDYLSHKRLFNGQRVTETRLTLSKVDHAFFKSLIFGGSPVATADSHQRLRKAASDLNAGLFALLLRDSQKHPAAKLAELKFFLECITMHCQIIEVVSQEHSEAYRIFSALNYRGMPLSDTDLLRSYTLALVENHPELATVETLWDNIRQLDDQTDDFLRHFYASKQARNAPRRDMWAKYVEHFFSDSQPPVSQASEVQVVVAQVVDMNKEAAVYKQLVRGEWPYSSPQVAQWGQNRLSLLLRRLEHTLCLPLLLAAHRVLNESEFAEIVHILERFFFRFKVIASGEANRMATAYRNQVEIINTNPSQFSVASLQQALADLCALYADDAKFSANFDAKLHYKQGQTTHISYFLLTLNSYFNWYLQGATGKMKPDLMTHFHLDQVTIDHVYPQKPEPVDFDPTLEPWKQTIGNLTILASVENSACSNKLFSIKRQNYSNSHVAITRNLASNTSWTTAEIAAHKQHLLDMALCVFRI